MNKFILFGQLPFSSFAQGRMAAIARNIQAMSDVEVLMYKDGFEELVKKLVSHYSLLPVDISFEDKIVDLIGRNDQRGKRYFAEYTLLVKGDAELLRCDPHNLGYVSLTLPVTVKTNIISFEIDTRQYSQSLSDQALDGVKNDYEAIKAFIGDTLLALNNESQKFNLQIEEFIIPILARRLRSADHYIAIKDKLNFK